MEKEARLSGKIQSDDWNAVLVLNKTPCFKGSHAASDCFRLEVYGSPLNMWKDAGQEGSGLWVGETRDGEQFGGSPELLVCSSCHFMHLLFISAVL